MIFSALPARSNSAGKRWTSTCSWRNWSISSLRRRSSTAAQLRFKPHPQPLWVQVDPRLIKQTILNLMINALQAMPNGGELILTAGAGGGNAVVDVIDTGTGIPAEALDKIFQAYYSTKRGGTGLGLAMALRIVQEHGGQLTVSSEPVKGSDFRITLPMA